MKDLHARVNAGEEAIDGGLLGSVYITSADDIAIHQDAIDADDIDVIPPSE